MVDFGWLLICFCLLMLFVGWCLGLDVWVCWVLCSVFFGWLVVLWVRWFGII